MTDGPRRIVPGSLGVFGGTFDPIHVAHLAVAEEAAEALGLERVVFIPAGQPPHKPGQAITPATDRLAMVELAIAGNERFAVDRLEVDRAGPSWTVDTLEALRTSRLAAGVSPDLTLVLSAEAFLGLMTWREPRRVLELARVVVAPRDGYPDAGPDFLAEHLPESADRATFLDGPRLRLSASELRARAASGRSLRYLVPDAVAAYIGDHDLYQDQRRKPRS
ncbi:MAG: nicotinate-nucleotide adenylyltransferase [Chloroflexota bacterium]